MSKSPRPSLAGMQPTKFAAAATSVAGPAPEILREPAARSDTPTPRRAAGDLKTVQVRINKAGWRTLRDLASDNDTSLEALMVEALNDLCLKHKRPPIVQRRIGVRGQEREE